MLKLNFFLPDHEVVFLHGQKSRLKNLNVLRTKREFKIK